MAQKRWTTYPAGKHLWTYRGDGRLHDVRSRKRTATSVSIGKPIANTEAYVLDQQLEPVAIMLAVSCTSVEQTLVAAISAIRD